MRSTRSQASLISGLTSVCEQWEICWLTYPSTALDAAYVWKVELTFTVVFPVSTSDTTRNKKSWLFWECIFSIPIIGVMYFICVINLCFITRGFIKYFKLELLFIQFLASISITLLSGFINTFALHLKIMKIFLER